MRKKCLTFFSIMLILLAFIAAPGLLLAANVTITVPTDFSTIQAAINDAASLASINTGTTYSVFVEPGTYTEKLTLASGVSVTARETARTIINGGGTGTAVTASGITQNIVFSNFTIINATIGIQVSGTSSVGIRNNVFNLGTSSTAVQVTGSPSADVINNTFYQNGVAVQRDSDSVKIVNNIFSNNTTDISQAGVLTQNNIDFNCFNPAPVTGDIIGTNYIPNLTVTDSDPRFVDPTVRDFHLQQDSTSISAGTNVNGPNSFNGAISDLGAYGGPGSDTIPYPVTVTAADKTTSTSITVSWNANKSYLVTNTAKQGSYNVYYSFDKSGAPYASKTNIASPLISTEITGLTGTTTPPAAPTLAKPEYADSTLFLSWSAVSSAAGYKVYYLDSVTSVENVIDVGNTTSYVLSGLVNQREYGITVSAYSQATYYIAVTALDNTGNTATPGSQHESTYSTEQKVLLGSAVEGLRSSPTQTEYPDPIVAVPDLPNKGCFVATAAYGHYSAPQVQLLRDFRDRFLMTHGMGRAFVAWYYRYGPIGAEYINAHPWLKPVVRVILLPALGGSFLLLHSSLWNTSVIMLCILMTALYIVLKRKYTLRRGGER